MVVKLSLFPTKTNTFGYTIIYLCHVSSGSMWYGLRTGFVFWKAPSCSDVATKPKPPERFSSLSLSGT